LTISHSPRSRSDRTRREDRHLKFYELRDNLRIGETPASPPDGTGDQQPMALRHLQYLSLEAARLTVNVHVPVIDRAKKERQMETEDDHVMQPNEEATESTAKTDAGAATADAPAVMHRDLAEWRQGSNRSQR